MTYSWILIIALHTPGGDFIGKNSVGFHTQKDCESVKVQLANLDSPMKVSHKGLCVTRDHWVGTKQMPGINLD